MALRAALLLLFLAMPLAAAGHEDCGAWRVARIQEAGLTVDAGTSDACAGAAVATAGVCAEVVWGVDLGLAAVGGWDGCSLYAIASPGGEPRLDGAVDAVLPLAAP